MTDTRALTCELRLGKWQDALADVGMVDTLITDPPYSERTHSGHDEISSKLEGRRTLGYVAWSVSDVRAFVVDWSPRVRGWMVAITDHVLAPAWEDALARSGRYTFAPLQFMHSGSRVRINGDGPALWSVTIVVARPRSQTFLRWGSLPGGYVLPPGSNDRSDGKGVIGGKPLWLMRALVRDYSRPGDLICDPCAGGATTLIAARMEGRRAIGAEMDPDTHALASKRLARPYALDLFTSELRERAANDNSEQQDMFDMGDAAADGGGKAPA